MHTSRTLVMVGLVLVLVGGLDPLEGSLAILVGSGLAALGAYLGQSPRWAVLAVALVLVALGIAGMIVLSLLGGIGGGSELSPWWGILLVPYVAGLILNVTGVALWAIDALRGGGNEGEAGLLQAGVAPAGTESRNEAPTRP
jgi:hypothetical protein